jgi:malonate-semialdehyde dehydrogenase (acetylating)/methylmalonate-semialdehyde dehydrogenase
VAITVGDARPSFTEQIAATASSRKVGYGAAPGVEMGPVISAESKARIEGLIAKGQHDGARVLVDGRGAKVPDYEDGYFVFPTILDNVAPNAEAARTEIFGPVLSLMHAQTIEEAIALVNGRSYGNMACIFTTDGANARRFRYEVNAGNVGINVGVAAPMSTFPFSGWGESFFGDLHAQAHHSVEFFTQTKVVVERWPREWSRKF